MGGCRSPGSSSEGAKLELHECIAKFRWEQYYQQHFTIQVILITAGARWVGNSNKKPVLLKKKIIQVI